MKNSESLKAIDKEPSDLDASENFDDFARSNYGYSYDLGESEPKINFAQYWQAIRKRIPFILGLCAITTALTTFYVAQKPDYYTATARVQVNLESNPAMSGAKGGFVFPGMYDPTYFSSQLQIIEGSGLLRRVVVTQDLENNELFSSPRGAQNRSTWQNVLRMLGVGKPDMAVQQQASGNREVLKPQAPAELPAAVEDDREVERLEPYVGKLKTGLTVSAVREDRVNNRETRLIDITFMHESPQVANKIANAIADSFVAQNNEKRIAGNETAGDFLQRRIAELQSEVRIGEERLINYARNNQIISLDAGQNTVVQRLADLNVRLSQAEGDRIMAEAAYRASLLPGAATAQTDSDERTAKLESRLSELRNQRVRLLVEYTEEAPELVEINKQITLGEQELKDTRNRATKTLNTVLETKYKENLAREQNLRTVFNQQRSEVLSQNEAAINYRIIQQEIATNKSLLDSLLQRSKENDVLLSGTPNNVLVVDRALMPREPVGPKRAQYVALAFLASLALGVGLALFLNYLDDTMHTANDVESRLRLPVLCDVPSVPKSKLMLSLAPLPGRKRGETYSLAVLDLQNRPALAEAYMHLRTSVLLATAGGPPEILLVTSAQPSEGKTTTAINMAKVLAQTGVPVLLIDADLRRPSLHTIFGLNQNGYDLSKGLSSLLTTKILDENALTENIKFHEASGVHVITSGELPPNPANLLCSPQMEQLLALLRTKFAHIVIDSPPVTFFTDGVLLSRLVDGVLLVVRSGKSHFDVAKRAKKLLWDAGAKFFGVVLNDVPRHKNKYDYPYGYGSAGQAPETD
ncbi:MAG: GumC family protein, partial [Pyrinomonadaceae bacterium]